MELTECESCANFEYNSEYDCYECIVSLDEDEIVRLEQDSHYSCPYFRLLDEYKIVRKQN